MRLLLLITLVLAGCQAPKPISIDEARDRFYWAVEKARQRPCVPDYVERAYQDLTELHVTLEDSLEKGRMSEEEYELEMTKYYGQDEQAIDMFKTGVCNEAGSF